MLQSLLDPIHSTEKQKLLQAIERLGPTVTPQSVALETGLPILSAVRQLNVVASETGAHLEVDSKGNIAYSFSPNFGGSYVFDITKKLFYTNGRFFVKLFKVIVRITIGLTMALTRLALGIIWFLFRISFGLILIGSIMLIVFGVIALLTGGEGGDIGDIGGDIGSDLGGAACDTNFGVNFGDCFVDLFRCLDLLRYCDWRFPFEDDGYRSNSYSYARQDAIAASAIGTYAKSGAQSQSNTDAVQSDFLMDFFSFLFGDGDPNPDLEQRQRQFLGKVIERNNGVVIAEQLAPYVGKGNCNEDWMLPVLVHFNGVPDVTERGDIVYFFPSFVKTSNSDSNSNAAQEDADQLRRLYRNHLSRKSFGSGSGSNHLPTYLRERNWVFSFANDSSITLIVVLAIINLCGSIWLQTASLTTRSLMGLHDISTFMVAFALFVIVVPLSRSIVIPMLNWKIDEKNENRSILAAGITTPDEETNLKLAEARRLAQTLICETGSEIVYTTDRDVLEQQFQSMNDGSDERRELGHLRRDEREALEQDYLETTSPSSFVSVRIPEFPRPRAARTAAGAFLPES